MIGIIDYSLGNIQNIKNALQKLGYTYIVSNEREALEQCDTILLPGVGHFGRAMKTIEYLGIKNDLIELARSKRFIGICLGMQLLFEFSEEGNTQGLGLLKGNVHKINTRLPVPHLGWNTLKSGSPVLEGHNVYFIHSYKADKTDDIIASADYGLEIPAIAKRDNIIGIQFHPEKSGEVGLNILRHAIEGGI